MHREISLRRYKRMFAMKAWIVVLALMFVMSLCGCAFPGNIPDAAYVDGGTTESSAGGGAADGSAGSDDSSTGGIDPDGLSEAE